MYNISLPGHLFRPNIKIDKKVRKILHEIKILVKSQKREECIEKAEQLILICKYLIFNYETSPVINYYRYREIIDCELADFLAFHHEAIKNNTSYFCDIERSINQQLGIKELPDIIYDIVKDKNDIAIDFTEINRLMNIYLIREDLSFFKNVDIDKGILRLESESLCFYLALCHSLDDPKWKTIKIEVNNGEILPSYLNMFQNIEECSNFCMFFESSKILKELHEKCKNSYKKGDFGSLLTGSQLNFQILVFNVLLTVKIIKNNARFSLKTRSGVKYLKKDKIQNMIEIVEEEVKKEVLLVFYNTILQYYKDNQNDIWFLNQTIQRFGKDIKYSLALGLFYKDIQTDDLISLENIYYKTSLKEEFYDFFKSFKNVTFHENYLEKSFGKQNILLIRGKNFLCIKLESFRIGKMGLRLFVGQFNIHSHFISRELAISIEKSIIQVSNTIKEVEKVDVIEIKTIHDFFRGNINYIIELLTLRNFNVLVDNGLFITAIKGTFVFYSKLQYKKEVLICNLRYLEKLDYKTKKNKKKGLSEKNTKFERDNSLQTNNKSIQTIEFKKVGHLENYINFYVFKEKMSKYFRIVDGKVDSGSAFRYFDVLY